MSDLDSNLVRQSRHHLQLAIENSDSLVPVRLTRALVDAQIASTLLRLHELELAQSAPFADDSSLASPTIVQLSDSFTLDVIARVIRERSSVYSFRTYCELVDQIIEALKESGRK
jgi:hypothetical protein